MDVIDGTGIVGKLNLVLNSIGRLAVDVQATVLDDLTIGNGAELVSLTIIVDETIIDTEGLSIQVDGHLQGITPEIVTVAQPHLISIIVGGIVGVHVPLANAIRILIHLAIHNDIGYNNPVTCHLLNSRSSSGFIGLGTARSESEAQSEGQSKN